MNGNPDFLALNVVRNDFQALLEDRRKEKELTDVQLKVGNKLFDAHRVVLSLYSPVLKALISEQWSTTKICLLSEEYVAPDIVEDLLSFLYTGSVILTPGNVHPICMAAHYLQTPALLEPSSQHLCRFITTETVLELLSFAESCQLEPLRERCLQFKFDNIVKVLQSDSILEFSFKDFKDFVVDLKTRYAGTTLREHTFHCIVRWPEIDLAKRLEHLPILLRNIPLVELSPKFLTETVSIHPLVKNSTSCQEEISTILSNKPVFKYDNLHWKQNMIVLGKQQGKRYFGCYDSISGTWRKLPEFLSPRICFVATVTNQQNIIITGGGTVDDVFIDWYADNSVEMFDWRKQAWTMLPPIPINLTGLSIGAHKDHLYAFGGHDNGGFSVALKYSFRTMRWQEIRSLNGTPFQTYRNLSFGHLISFKNSLYFISSIRSNIVKYVPALDKWTHMTPIQAIEGQFTATLHQDKIHISSESYFLVYDPEDNSKTYLQAFGNFKSLLSINGKLFAIRNSSADEQGTNNLVYELNPEFGIEIEADKMKIGENFQIEAALVGEFY